LYPITLEYRENTGTSKLQLDWSAASEGLTQTVVPQGRLFSSAAHISSSPFTVNIGKILILLHINSRGISKQFVDITVGCFVPFFPFLFISLSLSLSLARSLVCVCMCVCSSCISVSLSLYLSVLQCKHGSCLLKESLSRSSIFFFSLFVDN